MPVKDIFSKPFDDGTKIKLDLYKRYLSEWAPVFFSAEKIYWNTIRIFDFFAGEGQDNQSYKGSPLIAIDILDYFSDQIRDKNLCVELYLNEYDIDKYNALHSAISPKMSCSVYKIFLSNEDFKIAFGRLYPKMKDSANLIFLDQNGIKQVTKDVFQKVTALKKTDMLFFISSSFISRFAEQSGFKEYLGIEREDILSQDYYHIHKVVLEYYKSLISSGHKYYLAPFSIKKNTNIYGLIFGSNHTLGLEKFLNVCWKLDTQRGEANFDIDTDKIDPARPSLFHEYNVPKKRQMFEAELKAHILNGRITTDVELYQFALENGFLLKDANEVLKQLRNTKIAFEFKPITNNVHKIKSPSKIYLTNG